MRPRFANRGSTDSGRSLRYTSLCFNEAPIRESGKLRAHETLLEMATGFNEAPIRESGKFKDGYEEHDDLMASMRPRFANRGSAGRRDEEGLGKGCFNEAPIRESGKLRQGPLQGER